MDPWEQLLKTINGTVYDPVTKTPIHIDNQNLAVTELQKRESPEAIKRYIELLRYNSGGLPVTGNYSPKTKAIDVTINPWATYDDYRQALAHEKMHEATAVAAPGKELAPYPDGKQAPGVVADYLKRLLPFNVSYAPGPEDVKKPGIFGLKTPWSPMVPGPEVVYPGATTEKGRQDRAAESWVVSRNAGYMPLEYPVYMMQNPKDVGATPEQSDEYTKRYVKQLPVKVGKRVLDIRNQSKAKLPKIASDIIPSAK